MTDKDNNSGEILLKISASVGEKQTQEAPVTPKLEDGYKLLKRTNIEPARVKRNTEHGLTDVQTLKFMASEQRLKALQLLDNPAFYPKLPNLFDFISDLGCDNNAEKRFYAAIAVGELSASQPFVDLKEKIILRWATSIRFDTRQSAAMALSYIIKHEQWETDILKLLNHWISINNPSLNDTGLLTYYRIAQSYPHQTLEAIKNVLNKENLFLSFQIIDIVAKVYDLYPRLVIDYLHKWLMQNEKIYLRWMAGLLFLLMVRLDDISRGQESVDTRAKIVEIIFKLWDDPKLPMHLEMQEDTTKKVESWAKETLTARENDELDSFESYRKLFYELYQKYEGQKINRLNFHLQRWQKHKEWERTRAGKLAGNDSAVQQKKQGGFVDLIPQI
jgi:hypothetical protein